jgi:hypothetical protein
MRTSARFAVSFAVASAIFVLALPGLQVVSKPLKGILDSVSERVLTSLMEPDADPANEAGGPLPEEESCAIDPVLSSLEERDPIEAAAAAVRKGNFVLLGVSGDGVQVPGKSENLACWADRQGVLPIPGTTDVFSCAEQIWLQEVANRFAARYNDALIQELRIRFPDVCTG